MSLDFIQVVARRNIIHIYIYLASSDHARSAVLLRKEHLEEMPVYCVSMLMTIVEQRYSRLQVIRLALITAARRLNLIL
jgi:hypothetical protein